MFLKKIVYKYQIVFIGITALVFWTASTLVTYRVLSSSAKPNQQIQVETSNNSETQIVTLTKNYYNILLLGYGGPGHPGGTLSDVLMLVHIVPEEKKIALISIPRDTWVTIPERSDLKQNNKINAAFAIGSDDNKYPLKEPQYKGEHGGGEMAKVAVEEVVGMPIDYYVGISFDGFSQAIDILEEVEVDVPVAFDDYFYPVKGLENEPCGFSAAEIAELTNTLSGFELEKQFECRYEQLSFDKGKTTMDGETALKFVRSRHSAQSGGDFARSQRQQALLVGIRDKLLDLGALDNTMAFFNKFVGIIKTDIDETILASALEMVLNPSEYTIQNINLTEENVFVNSRSSAGAYILIPKEGEGVFSGIHTYIIESLNRP